MLLMLPKYRNLAANMKRILIFIPLFFTVLNMVSQYREEYTFIEPEESFAQDYKIAWKSTIVTQFILC